MNIVDLKVGQKGVVVQGEVTEKSPTREFMKFGRTGKVCNVVLKDDSGNIMLTLWNDQIDEVDVGDSIRVSLAQVNQWMGVMQITCSRNGKIEHL